MKKILVLLSMCFALTSFAQVLTPAQEIMLMNTRPPGMPERQALEIISNFTPKAKYDFREQNIPTWRNLLPYLHTEYYYREVGLLKTTTLPMWYQTPHQLASVSDTRLDIGLLFIAAGIFVIVVLVALNSFLSRELWDPKTISSWIAQGSIIAILLSNAGIIFHACITFGSGHGKIHHASFTNYLYSVMFCIAAGLIATLLCALCVFLKRNIHLPKVLQPV